MKVAKRQRAAIKAKLTRKCNQIKVILDTQTRGEENDLTEKIQSLTTTLEEFHVSHKNYVVFLSDEEDRDEADIYVTSVDGGVKATLKSAEEFMHALQSDIDLGDSVSQCGTTSSVTSTTSALQLRTAARKASLAVEAASLKRRQEIESQELLLRQQREELDLQMRLDMADAEESVLQQREMKSQTRFQNIQNQTIAIEDIGLVSRMAPLENQTRLDALAPDFEPVREPVKQAAVPVPDESTLTETGILQLLQDGQQQQRQLLEAVQLPRAELSEYDGDPLQFSVFMRAFQNTVDNSMLDSSSKLMRLLHYCTGPAKRVIECCSIMEPKQGYIMAKQLLNERFGNDHIIAEAWIKKVTQGPKFSAYEGQALRLFSDDLMSCGETLKSMGYEGEINSQSVLVAIVERLPSYARNWWLGRVRDIRKRDKRSPNISDLIEYVNDIAEEATDPIYGRLIGKKEPQSVKGNSRFPRSPNKQYTRQNYSVSTSGTLVKECLLCKGEHDLFTCVKFKEKRPDDRLKFARDRRLCFNCLSPGHMSNKCSLNRTCTVEGCGRKHTKFLHQPKPPVGSNGSDNALTQSVNRVEVTDVTCSVTGAGAQWVALPIVPVKVKGLGKGGVVDTYALLDNGSTSSFCTEKLVTQLGIQGKRATLSLTTLEKQNSQTDTSIVSLEVTGCNEMYTIELPVVYTKSTLHINKDNIACHKDVGHMPHLADIGLPDVNIQDIGLLIGQDVPDALMPLEIRKGPKGSPFAVRTQLGWVINGPLGSAKKHKAFVNFVQEDNLEEQLHRFWTLDASEALLDDQKAMSVNDRRAVAIWDSTVKLKGGHYEVSIPFRQQPPFLPSNKLVAEHRLALLKRRLSMDPQLCIKYKRGMTELMDLGYAEPVEDKDLSKSDGTVWYLPHHPVVQENKPDKVRIVFDCAAKYKGTSLNDNVLPGPDLTNKLLGVLLRFRQEPIALMADIQTMFHQVRVPKEDRDVLRYMWWPDGKFDTEPKVYRMMVHLFGGTWSPSCCSYVLRHTALENQASVAPNVVKTVLRDFYVDDCLTSVDSEASAISLVKGLRDVLAKGGFRLTKWLSNSPGVLQSIPESERAKNVKGLDFNFEAMPTERALGVYWDVELDSFKYNVSLKEKPLTRRGLLSFVSSIYDPHGYLSPYILKAKLIIQELSRRKLSWDEQLPDDMLDDWLHWQRDLKQLEVFKVNRCIKPHGFGEVTDYQLHHFSDASQVAYGAMSYLRMTNSMGEICSGLVMAKSRLSPIKTLTVPRLELTAATLSVKLDAMIRRELDLQISESVFWTDSTIVLQYLRSDDKRFHTFVANRVAVIHEGSAPSQWHHVDTKSNPADDISRGLTAKQILTNQRWLCGPEFLSKEREQWPNDPTSENLSDNDPEVKIPKRTVVYFLSNVNPRATIDHFVQKHSSWVKLKKCTAWLLRVKCWLKSKVRGHPLPIMKCRLTIEELKQAEIALCRHVQEQEFSNELRLLNGPGVVGEIPQVGKASPLCKLTPFIAQDGTIRVGGRLSKAPIPDRMKFPVILPKGHYIAGLIIRHFHDISGHAGREHVFSLIRERFWLVNARALIRNVLKGCIVCNRLFSKPIVQKMADLPVDRVTPGDPPFSHVGIDYFGPFYIKVGRSHVKRYGCLFTCLVVRAVHIEISSSLETDSFIQALQRFICCRGQPRLIRNDNGANFAGAEREHIKSWNQNTIHDYLLQQEIAWKFNTPTASHMGGVWERQIRTVRRLMSALCKEQTLDEEGLSTLMCAIEAIINGRPITVVSDDCTDPEPLTPNHLLLLRAGSSLLHGEYVKRDLYSRKRWRRVHYLADVFWKRWTREYLPKLQQRHKWMQPTKNIEVGDIVVVMDVAMPRNKWTLGRIVEVFSGADGLVRSARVKTKSSSLVRPVHKLCLLESVERSEGDLA